MPAPRRSKRPGTGLRIEMVGKEEERGGRMRSRIAVINETMKQFMYTDSLEQDRVSGSVREAFSYLSCHTSVCVCVCVCVCMCALDRSGYHAWYQESRKQCAAVVANRAISFARNGVSNDKRADFFPLFPS
mmetsp:Transcript_43047/g.69351  ORF Transcript_43047/g.69351 Transcript_43047/m.69351 type:complete len:131 (+) Transcript_43047:943-1335(+)